MGRAGQGGTVGERRLRVLGVDPGSQVTGYGVVDRIGTRVEHVAHGTLRPTRGAALHERLAEIHRGLSAVVVEHEPEAAVVEQAFVGTNARSAMTLGQARGAALVAVGSLGIPVHEFSPREIKLAVVGTGTADKGQVQRMVKALLSLGKVPPQDAADALAAALCRAYQGPLAGFARTGATPRRTRGRRSASFVVRRGR